MFANSTAWRQLVIVRGMAAGARMSKFIDWRGSFARTAAFGCRCRTFPDRSPGNHGDGDAASGAESLLVTLEVWNSAIG